MTDERDGEYGKHPLPGTVTVPCKNKNCSGAVESGFVYNVEDWIELFVAKEYVCPICKSKYSYSRDDVVTHPAKR